MKIEINFFKVNLTKKYIFIYYSGVSGELALQSVSSLSGGQKSRVALTCLFYPQPNFLVLDEITNHLG